MEAGKLPSVSVLEKMDAGILACSASQTEMVACWPELRCRICSSGSVEYTSKGILASWDYTKMLRGFGWVGTYSRRKNGEQHGTSRYSTHMFAGRRFE